MQISAGDVLVVAQKIVSKAEGRPTALDQLEPDDARALAAKPARTRDSSR